MKALESFAAEFAITITNGEVWLSIGLALVLGAGCLVFGTWVARTVGLLGSDAPAGETLGVGLGSGLMVLAAWWAAIWSGGRSSFTPVAVGFAIAIGLAVARRVRRPDAADARISEAPNGEGDAAGSRSTRLRAPLITALAGGLFVVAVALLYGSTTAPSPREGVQPVEFNDEAFYAILGRDLATTGTETHLPPSGFTTISGLPAQTWYHWAELWLASAVITVFGTAPLAARYLIVLPIVLLAAAALTGTLVRRMTRTNSRWAYAFGFLVCLFLAPVPLIPGPFFSSWAVGMIFGINLYGLAAVAMVLALYSVAVLDSRPATWALAGFVGSAVAFVLPAHIAVAILALVGVGTVAAIRVGHAVIVTRRMPTVSPVWRRSLVASSVMVLATVVWAAWTGHSMGAVSTPAAVSPLPATVSPFNDSWRDSVAITTLGAGVFFAIVVAMLLRRKTDALQADLYLGTLILLVIGAIGWGARLGDFTMFYLFFGAIAVIATPVAAVAVYTVWERLRATKHLRLAVGLVVLCAIQLELGVVNGVLRLQAFGPQVEEVPIPLNLIASIRQLHPEAKLAYACEPFDESGFGVPRLLSIDAHTGRRVVPMCFEADVFNALIGGQRSLQVPNSSFIWAPQRELYPDAAADPSSESVAAFLKQHGIDYIFVDALHPNSLVANAVRIAASGDAEVLRVP